MSKNFDELAKKLREEHYVESNFRKKDVESTDLKDYKEALEKNYTLLVQFSYIGEDNLTTEIDGVKIICPKNEFVGTEYMALSKEYEVFITSIDEEKAEVYVSAKAVTESNVVTKKEEDVRNLEKQIKQKKAQGIDVVYPCRAIKVIKSAYNHAVLLKCMDTDLIVKVQFNNFTLDQDEVIDNSIIGKYYDIEIVKKIRSKTNEHFWEGTRLSLVENPWFRENIEEEYQVGKLISVKCTNIDRKKNRWFGTSSAIKGLRIMGDFNEKADVWVEVGKEYNCFIKKINAEKQQFVVKPLSVKLPTNSGDGTSVIFREH